MFLPPTTHHASLDRMKFCQGCRQHDSLPWLPLSRGFDPKFQPRESRVISVLIEEGRNKLPVTNCEKACWSNWANLVTRSNREQFVDLFKSSELQSLRIFDKSIKYPRIYISYNTSSSKIQRLSISFCIRKRNLRISWMNKKRGKLKFSIHIFLVQPLSSKRSSIIFRWSLWLKLPLWSLHASGSRCRNGASRFFFFLFNR